MDQTVREIRASIEYHNIPRGTRFNDKTKSRCNKMELCSLLTSPPNMVGGGGGGNEYPNCTWSVRQLKQSPYYRNIPRGTVISNNGMTKSRARKLDLCTYMEQLHLSNNNVQNNNNIIQNNNNIIQNNNNNIIQNNNNNIIQNNNNNIIQNNNNVTPVLVTIRLNTAYDPNRALGAINEIGEHFTEHCPEYTQQSFIMNSRSNLIHDIFGSIQDNSVAQLVFITHGDSMLLQTGRDFISMDSNHFDVFLTELRRILMVNATIILVACRTGHIDGQTIGYNRVLTSYQFTNWPDVNIAAKIANGIPGVAVFATPRIQVQDELQLYFNQPNIYDTICDASRPRPVYSGVISSNQPVYKFIRLAGQNEQLQPTIEVGN